MITVTPEIPTSYDQIVIEFHVTTCGGTFVKTKTDSQFTLTWDPLPPLAGCELISPPIPRIVEYHVGMIGPGSYEAIWQRADDQPVIQSFQVTQGIGEPPVLEADVSIPTLGVPATILLAVGLAWMTSRFMKRLKIPWK